MKVKLFRKKYSSYFVIGKQADPKFRTLKTTSTWIALVEEDPICFICDKTIRNEGIFCKALKKFYCFNCEAQEISPCYNLLSPGKKEHIDTICQIKVIENG